MPKINNTFNNSKFRGFSKGYKNKNPAQSKSQSKFNKFSKTYNLIYNYSSYSNIHPKNFGNTTIKLSKNMNLDDMEITKEEINTAKQKKINEKKKSFSKTICRKI